MRRSFRFVYVGRICIVILHILFWGDMTSVQKRKTKKEVGSFCFPSVGGCMQKGREEIGVAEEKYWSGAE